MVRILGLVRQSTAPIAAICSEAITDTRLLCLRPFLEPPPLGSTSVDQGGLSGGVTQTFIPEGPEPLVTMPLLGYG